MEQVYIEDKQGNKVLPITHVNAVRDDNGNSLPSIMGAFEDEVRGLVDTPHENYVTVAATSQTTAAEDVLPDSGQSADTIYRVSNWDGSANSGAGAFDVTSYSEYAWDDVSSPNKYIFLCKKTQIGEVFDITVYNNNTKYADLAAALGTNGANIPESLRKGGMSIKFVHAYDNKYVQFFLTKDEWSSSEADWEKMNLEGELDRLHIDVNGEVWTKDTELTYINQNSTSQQVGIEQGRQVIFELIRCNVDVTIYLKYKDDTTLVLGGAAQGDKIKFVASKDIKLIWLYSSSSSSDGTKYIVTVQGCVQKIDELEESASNLSRTVYDDEWSKDTQAIYLNEYYTKQEVNIKQGEDFSCSLVRANISGTVSVLAKYTDNTSSIIVSLSVGDTFLATAQKDISYVYLYSDVTSSTGSKFIVKRLGLVSKVEKNTDAINRIDNIVGNNTPINTVRGRVDGYINSTGYHSQNGYFVSRPVFVNKGAIINYSVGNYGSNIAIVVSTNDITDFPACTWTIEDSVNGNVRTKSGQIIVDSGKYYAVCWKSGYYETGVTYDNELIVGFAKAIDNNSKEIQQLGTKIIDNPFAGKNVVVLGDSHAQHRSEWMPKLCELTKMNYLSELNSLINVGNDVPSTYEMYFHPLRAQLQALIDNQGTTNVDVILVENVHYRKIGNAKDYSFHPSQLLSFDTYNMTKDEEEAYWQANFALIVGSFPSSSQKADTLLKSTITRYTRVITFSSSAVSAGLFTLSIDGHDFASDITSGMTLAQAIAEIYTWAFGDYCDWENISFDSTSITIRYKGSSSDPSINFSVNAGTTNISATVSGSNTQSTSKVYRYLESATDSDFLVKEKWHKMQPYFYNGYRTLKGFFEDININFPNAKVVVFSVPDYSFSSFDEHLNMGNFMETQQYTESTENGEQMLNVAKLYSAITINVEKECGISPFNWFNFYSANNVHPKTVGYERWAETITRFLI